MSSFIRSFLTNIGVVGIVLGALYVLALNTNVDPEQEQMPAVAATAPPYEELRIPTEKGVTPDVEILENAGAAEIEPATHKPRALPAEAVDSRTRLALVNILCETPHDIAAISGSGVIIDPKGIILTNAHVAQYILLANHSNLAISCTVRTGSPAQGSWKPEILFLPPLWIDAHAKDIVQTRSPGTGENDYALLYIPPADTKLISPPFPHLEVAFGDAAGRTGDRVLVAAYPAESADETVLASLYASTVPMEIKKMLTFTSRLVDVFSLGGTTIAQGGSSGGAVVNSESHLIGIVTTTSESIKPEARDLRAITLAHVDRSIKIHTQASLEDLLVSDPAAAAESFKPIAQQFANLLVAELSR